MKKIVVNSSSWTGHNWQLKNTKLTKSQIQEINVEHVEDTTTILHAFLIAIPISAVTAAIWWQGVMN